MWNQINLALLPLAQEAGSTYGGTEGPDLTRYFTVSVILIVAIGGLAFGFKRLISGNLKSRAGKRSLQVLDVLPLGGKQRLAVVRCYDRTFALGLGDKEVTAIAELDPVIGADEAQSDAEPEDEQTFQRALAHVQDALAKSRQGVGPTGPLRAQSKRQTTVAQLLGEVDAHATRREAAAAEAPARSTTTSNQRVPATDAAARPARKPKARKTKRRQPAQSEPQVEAAPRRTKRPAQTKARRKPAAAPPIQSLGLEGVMG